MLSPLGYASWMAVRGYYAMIARAQIMEGGPLDIDWGIYKKKQEDE